MWKMHQLVCGAEIWTQDLLIISLLLKPPDQGTHPEFKKLLHKQKRLVVLFWIKGFYSKKIHLIKWENNLPDFNELTISTSRPEYNTVVVVKQSNQSISFFQNNFRLQECIYNTFRRGECLIRMNPDDPLTDSGLCFIIVTAYHGRRHSAILKLTLIMVNVTFLKERLNLISVPWRS